MIEEYDLNDYISVIYLKNILLTKSKKKIVELYKDYDDYIKFINTFVVMTNIDSAFLLLNNEIPERVSEVIQIHRYDTDLDSEVCKVINDIILYLNSLKEMPKNLKSNYIDNYIYYNEEIRDVDFLSLEQFYNTIVFDAVALIALISGKKELIIDEERFLISLNYLMNTIPEFFEKPEINNRVSSILKEFEANKANKHRFKKYVKLTKNSFSKLLDTKGE